MKEMVLNARLRPGLQLEELKAYLNDKKSTSFLYNSLRSLPE